MYYGSTTDALVASIIMGGVVGLLIGLVPLLVGFIKGHSRDGAIGLLLCVIFGALGGWVMAGIIGIFAVIGVARMPSAPSTPDRVPCPHCAEMIRPGAKVCRFCGNSLEASGA